MTSCLLFSDTTKFLVTENQSTGRTESGGPQYVLVSNPKPRTEQLQVTGMLCLIESRSYSFEGIYFLLYFLLLIAFCCLLFFESGVRCLSFVKCNKIGEELSSEGT